MSRPKHLQDRHPDLFNEFKVSSVSYSCFIQNPSSIGPFFFLFFFYRGIDFGIDYWIFDIVKSLVSVLQRTLQWREMNLLLHSLSTGIGSSTLHEPFQGLSSRTWMDGWIGYILLNLDVMLKGMQEFSINGRPLPFTTSSVVFCFFLAV